MEGGNEKRRIEVIFTVVKINLWNLVRNMGWISKILPGGHSEPEMHLPTPSEPVMLGITKTPVDVEKYIYVSEPVVVRTG